MPPSPVRSLLAPGIAALAAFAILVSLGLWQVERLAWKEDLIARVNARLDDSPVAAPGPAEWPGLDLADREYQPVSLAGRFLNESEIHVVYALTEPKGPVGGIGCMIMTPLVIDDGWIVWVNRGFVPAGRVSPDTRREGLIDGETTVVGLLRRPHGRSWFSPADDAAANQWFSRDPALYSAALGLPSAEVAPYIVDALHDPGLPGGLPQGGETIVSFPNSHLGYAITWFGLAAALAGVFAVFVLRRLRSVAP